MQCGYGHIFIYNQVRIGNIETSKGSYDASLELMVSRLRVAKRGCVSGLVLLLDIVDSDNCGTVIWRKNP